MTSSLSPRLLAGFGCLILAMAALGAFALALMDDLSARAIRIADENIPELTATARVQTALQEFRQLQLQALLERSPAAGGPPEADLLALGNKVTGGLAERGRIAPEADEKAESARLLSVWQRYVRQTTGGLAPGGAARQVLSGPAQADYLTMHDGLGSLRAEEEAQAAATSAAGQASYDRARRVFLATALAAVVGGAFFGLWLLVVRPLRRASAAESFRRRLHDALEMADNEEEALDIVGRSLGRVSPDVSAELLLADSSQAHLHRALVAGPDPEGPGCPVDAPRACAAVRRGQSTIFASSEDVGACPRLRDRSGGPCSAVCTPVTVLGRTIGVLHATGPVGHPPGDMSRDALETTATQVGSRLGVIRAMAQSQLQASTDPLTGLLNRRSLEDRVRDLRRAQIPFAVAMADLDHFKALNDSFGHETGDRALRLFARTLAEAVRVQDIVARHGGEEFVVIFPRCSGREVAEVLERGRAALEEALATGQVPEFTFSAGVAEAGPGEAFHDVLRAADEALMGAKRSGRDRVLIASSIRSDSIAAEA